MLVASITTYEDAMCWSQIILFLWTSRTKIAA